MDFQTTHTVVWNSGASVHDCAAVVTPLLSVSVAHLDVRGARRSREGDPQLCSWGARVPVEEPGVYVRPSADMRQVT